jgi:hypothetical protein
MKPKLGRATLALALAYALVGWCAEGRAEPLITQGVGIASCGKLANDLKPSQGLNHRRTICYSTGCRATSAPRTFFC